MYIRINNFMGISIPHPKVVGEAINITASSATTARRDRVGLGEGKYI